MSVVAKAVWLIETRLAAPPSLDELARVAGVSRFHLSRVFAATVGRPSMACSRARRLTEAARALDLGLSVTEAGLAAGFESPEGFSRAFREEFGLAPSTLGAGAGLDAINLSNPRSPKDQTMTTLAPPRIENRAPFTVAGSRARFTTESAGGIPALWSAFAPHLTALKSTEPGVAYGVCIHDPDADTIGYMAAAPVADGADAPPDLEVLRVPGGRYAVFTHGCHISEIRRTMHAIFDDWLPRSGEAPAGTPDFERYPATFDPKTGAGPVEVWIPLR